MSEPAVRPGYQIGRDGHGLTARERQVLACLAQGMDMPTSGVEIGVSKQRVKQIIDSLVKKEVVGRDEETGQITILVPGPRR